MSDEKERNVSVEIHGHFSFFIYFSLLNHRICA